MFQEVHMECWKNIIFLFTLRRGNIVVFSSDEKFVRIGQFILDFGVLVHFNVLCQ